MTWDCLEYGSQSFLVKLILNFSQICVKNQIQPELTNYVN